MGNSRITRVDWNGRSAQDLLESVLNDSPDKVMVVWTVGDRLFVGSSGSSDPDLLERMGMLAAMLIEEYTRGE